MRAAFQDGIKSRRGDAKRFCSGAFLPNRMLGEYGAARHRTARIRFTNLLDILRVVQNYMLKGDKGKKTRRCALDKPKAQ